MRAFQSSLDRLLPQLLEAHAKGDPAGVRHVAHTLKSSSASIGALRLSALCAELENAVRNGAVAGLNELVETVCSRSRNASGRPLPSCLPARDELHPLAGGRRPAGPPQVLLVDDDEVNLLLTSVALRERGFDVTEATSGEQALELLSDWLPDVVVLDALMPGLDGFETCRELRALPGFESLPVLMLTGLDDDASITRAYEAGATDFFVKSTQWSLLAGRLRYLLRSSRTRIELERSKSRWRARRTWRAWAASTGSAGTAARVFSAEALRVLGFGRRATAVRAACCACCPRTIARASASVLREVDASTARCWPPTCR